MLMVVQDQLRISFRGFPTVLQVAGLNIIYIVRGSNQCRFHCLSGSCPLFILLPVPFMNWGEGDEEEPKGQMILVPVCAVHRYLHGCTCMHACAHLYVVQKVTVSSSIIFHITLRKNFVYLLVVTSMNAMYLITYTLKFLLCLL